MLKFLSNTLNKRRLVAGMSLMLLASAATAGHHLNGTWKLRVTLDGQEGGTATFVLTEGEGGALTGTYSGAAGQSDLTGTVNGQDVEFTFDSQAGTVVYKGKSAGKTLSGTCTYGMLGSGTFEGFKLDQ